ncbi:MAG: GNAT family N-acetyltransferase [Anaerolineales bacterium]|nr:GNAT family N-acetyltransferase [Anaerolineales bacterium]
MDFEILEATWKDLKPVYDLEQLCFTLDAWPFLEYIGALTFPGVIRLKVVSQDNIIGFGMVDLRPSINKAIIATIAVHPDYRRQSIGMALMEEMESRIDLKIISLTVRASNFAAIRLYEKMGYQHVGYVPNYYRGREDGILMEKRS